MAIGSIYRVSVIQSSNGQRLVNVWHYKQTAGTGSTDPKLELATAIEAVINPVMVAALSIEWKTLCYEVAELDLPGQPFFKHDSAGTVGAIAGEAFNTAVAATVALFTATGSHDGTGRSFIGGIPITYENRNNLNTTGLTAIGTIGDELIKLLTGGGYTFQPGRAPGFKKDPASTIPVPLPDIATPFDPWILEDVRIPLTKIRSRRQSTKC